MSDEVFDESVQNASLFPNLVRSVREGKANLTRQQLISLCTALVQEDPNRFVPVSMTTLYHLELGSRRPRRTTAHTLATALGITVTELFPAGIDDPIHNPQGNTRIPADRPKGGRPKKKG